MGFLQNKNYPKWLLAIYAVLWLITAINPQHPQDFILENVLNFFLVAVIILTYKKFRLSNVSYTLIFVYMILVSIGAHYTYAEVPYDEWSKRIFGICINELFGFERNHYDRLVHFTFGLFMAYPIREIFMRIANVKGFWAYYLPFDVTLSFSAIYEIIEWVIAILFGGDLGTQYLGTQGDEWDAIKDMGLAALGAIISMSIVAFINFKYKKNFKEDMEKSLSIKRKTPLGEVELNRMKKKKNNN